MSRTPLLQVPGLGSKRLAELAEQAKSLGMTPQDYARELIQDALALEREARNLTFEEILGPLRSTAGKVDEDELDRLVDQARTQYHKKLGRKKR
jgi:DNA polymerase/3'-5' exonuclease PolX